ncbi:MAG: hypothetical protein M3Z08_05230 [Chloroflexota bacterium]|nr:hypothetical protein [Chloroflexota bacterium]
MDTHPYHYDNTAPWQPPQEQFFEARSAPARPIQQPYQRQRQQEGGLARTAVKPMPKARALALTRTLKRWLVATSLIGFLSFGGLVAFHQSDSTTTASQTPVTSSGSGGSQTNSTSSSDDSNSFLQQQGGNTVGTNNSSQAPVSGTHTS